MTKINNKHKTVGVSFSPLLRQKGGRRARQLGLSFSRYVSLCVEAEIVGRVSLSSLHEMDAQANQGMDEGVENDWSETRTLLRPHFVGHDFFDQINERLRADVGDVLERAQVSFARDVLLGASRTDFLVGVKNADGTNASQAKIDSGDGDTGAANGGVVIECRYPLAGTHAALLGGAVMLQQTCGVRVVLLCVPYLNIIEPQLHAVFVRQGIAIVTPDTLLQALDEYGLQ